MASIPMNRYCSLPLLLLASLLASIVVSFTVVPIPASSVSRRGTQIVPDYDYSLSTRLFADDGSSSSSSSSSPLMDDNDEEDDEEEVEPGKMRVSEITAELRLRGVEFSDCFDKESLVARLTEARASGKANPDIIDSFNKQKLEETFSPDKKVEISDDVINQAVANDGKLPGGMSPDMLKAMVSNPELMALLQSPKMQDAMKLMMTGGQDELEKALSDDPELLEIVGKLNDLMEGMK